MDVRELRIGNFVFDSANNTSVKIVADSSLWDRRHQLEDIPLTPKILLACGFNTDHETHDGIVWSKDYRCTDFGIWDDCTGGFSWRFRQTWNKNAWTRYREIKSLHQLQNLYYSLTGEELPVGHEKLKEALQK